MFRSDIYIYSEQSPTFHPRTSYHMLSPCPDMHVLVSSILMCCMYILLTLYRCKGVLLSYIYTQPRPPCRTVEELAVLQKNLIKLGLHTIHAIRYNKLSKIAKRHMLYM